MPSPLVPLGAVVRAHGVRGWVRVRPFFAGSEAFESARRLFLDGEPREIEAASRDRDEWLIKLRGTSDRDAAEALRGREVSLPREELPDLDEDELYVADLIGCTVEDPAGAPLGTILSVENSGMQELLTVATARGEALIPFVEPIIVSVDLAARRVVCDPPEGLLDLQSAPARGPDDGDAGDESGHDSDGK